MAIHPTERENQVSLLLGKTRRRDAWRRVFEQLDRIIGRTDAYTVSVISPREDVASMDVGGMEKIPAWSTGDHICLNADVIGEELEEMTLENYLYVKGLNLHELSHAMFTPRVSDFPYGQLTNDSARPGIKHVHNLMEDARIESLFTALYNASAPFFEAAVYKFILEPDETEVVDPKFQHALLAGRLYLPPEVRAAARAEARAVYGDGWVASVEVVLTEYVGLRFPKHNLRGVSLVRQMYDLLNEAQQRSSQPGKGIEQIARAGSCAAASKVGGKANANLQAQASASAEHWTDDEDLDEVEEEVTKAAEEAAGGDGDADAEEGEGGEADDGGDEGAPSTGAGTSTAPTSPVFAEAQKALEELQGDISVWDDYDRSIAAVRSILSGGAGTHIELDTKPMWIDPSEDALREAHRLEQIFTELHQALEPDWRYRQHTGRLDVRRVVTRMPHDVSVFKELTPGGLDEANMEFVILVDQSGSMAIVMKSLSEVLWIIKRASDAVDIPVTVIGYSERAYGLMNPQELVNRNRVPVWPSYTSTLALDATKRAADILGASAAPTRCLIVLSDGVWGDANLADPYIKAIREDGVMTTFFYFSSRGETVPSRHQCEHAVAVNKFEAVGDFFASVAETTMLGVLEALD